MYKQNFEEILESVQSQILSHFDVTEEEMEEATELFKDEPDIANFVTELENLYLSKLMRKERALPFGPVDEDMEHDVNNLAFLLLFLFSIQVLGPRILKQMRISASKNWRRSSWKTLGTHGAMLTRRPCENFRHKAAIYQKLTSMSSWTSKARHRTWRKKIWRRQVDHFYCLYMSPYSTYILDFTVLWTTFLFFIF